MARRFALSIFAAAMLAVPSPVLGQNTGPNGGLLAGREGHQTELLVSATELTVYVLDHGKVHDTKGVKLKAVIQDAGKTTSIDLATADAKRLVAKLPAPLGKG